MTPAATATPTPVPAAAGAAQEEHCDSTLLSAADYQACLTHQKMGQFHGHPAYHGLH